MSKPTIHGKPRVFSASAVRAEIAKALNEIKDADELTFADLGRVLGKSADQAAKYCDGSAEMGSFSFAAAKREWNGRFTGYFDRLCIESRPVAIPDRACECSLLKAALALSVALADDDEITPDEVRANRGTIEAARDALDGLLRKIVRAA